LAGISWRVNNAVQHIAAQEEGRRQPRTHLFVVATLYADSGSSPVNIRNMSPCGALIEAAVLPEPGARIGLRRGPLHATGKIAWRSDRRAGVNLDSSIHVADWMARLGSAGQAKVDAMVATVRGNAGASCLTPVAGPDSLSIEAELATLRSDLADLESKLIEDPILVATHPEIQTIDISLQRIDRIVQRLRGDG
jgi:hypothetical protein